jgi:hypothetical protein
MNLLFDAVQSELLKAVKQTENKSTAHEWVTAHQLGNVIQCYTVSVYPLHSASRQL